MFLKRQMEVSTEFAECMTERLLTSESLWHNLLTGSKSEAFVRQAGAQTPCGANPMRLGSNPTPDSNTSAEP